MAWMVHVPAAKSVAVEPVTVQMAGVVEVKLTSKPELAVADKVTPADVLTIWALIAPKLIVWASPVTVKLCVTDTAAA
jgi:hypothetical protein